MATDARLDLDELAASRRSAPSCCSSLDDLEREHDAGDIDEHDYDDPEGRLHPRGPSTVLRAIEAGQAKFAPPPPRPRGRR